MMGEMDPSLNIPSFANILGLLPPRLQHPESTLFAKLSSSSSPVELSTALILIISTPTHPPTHPPGIVVMRYF